MARIQRRGFLQEQVYARMGLHPWECPLCREVFLLKSRDRKHRKSHPVEKGGDK
jgi:hypothetical protein